MGGIGRGAVLIYLLPHGSKTEAIKLGLRYRGHGGRAVWERGKDIALTRRSATVDLGRKLWTAHQALGGGDGKTGPKSGVVSTATTKSLTLIFTPGQRQSTELLLKVNDIESALGHPAPRTEDSKLSCVYENGSRIVSLPATHTIRGYSAPDLIIIDEAAWVPDETYASIRPMLAINPHSRLIIMSTPHGKRGFFYDVWSQGSPRIWEKYSITADECLRISETFLQEERESLTDLMFRQEYYCEFIDTESQLFLTHYVDAAFTDDVDPLFANMYSGYQPLDV